ncbi:dTTP/UTP pyrophosphatase-like [Hippocampus zosterae]|uniref:dTTP/UTP pyrophosphatase-like n=1 Tax=Hippocampus zosterae TaxID=109293 RepID=UPI00223D3CC4|nr:dTTP/UTP pyrophosphatase-like [Hippocampus zosterae]
MLLPYLKVLEKHPIILGSSSASRKQLINFPEDLAKESFASPKLYCEATCEGKAADILKQLKDSGREIEVLVVADTIAAVDGKILEKPRDEDHCVEMMGKLAGRWHEGITAHRVYVGTKLYAFTTVDELKFFPLDETTLRAYARTGQPYAHSGGYRLNGMSGSFFEEIRGSVGFQGLHVGRVCAAIVTGLKEMGWTDG